MTNRNPPAGRAGKIIPARMIRSVGYWIATIWLALGMLATGALQLFKVHAEGALAPPGVYGITHLGYPVYFLTILGIWKILGVAALLVPNFPLLKEWAYAGFFFIMTGAIFSHIAVRDPVIELFPSILLLTMTVLSWYLRPADTRLYPRLNDSVGGNSGKENFSVNQ
ncbi:MAG: DoxX family protein [Chitinophagales bacterium]